MQINKKTLEWLYLSELCNYLLNYKQITKALIAFTPSTT